MTVETCPQYLWLSENDFQRLGTWMKMNPPVKTLRDQAALRAALRHGVISIVATDHAPHTDDEKSLDLDHALPGSPGVQTLYLSSLELAKQMGDVWMAPRWVSQAPAQLAGLDEIKGQIAPGFEADLVVVDPNQPTTFSPRFMRSRQRHGALDGKTSSFSIRSVYLRGIPVVTDGRLSTRVSGRMVRPVRVGAAT